jgi:hypothetical protein
MDNWELTSMCMDLKPAQAIKLLEFYMLNKADGELENEMTWLWEEVSPDLPHSRLRQMRNQQTGESTSWPDVNGSN